MIKKNKYAGISEDMEKNNRKVKRKSKRDEEMRAQLRKKEAAAQRKRIIANKMDKIQKAVHQGSFTKYTL